MVELFLTDLPPEVLEKIMSKLPIKTILACRCVCKTLLNLISFNSNQHLATLHSQNATQSLFLSSPLFQKNLKTIIIISTTMVELFLMDLPPGVLEEIMSKLPIKTILACRCVCKTLLDLTSNSNQHFATQNATQSLIIQFSRPSNKTLSESVYLFDVQTDINPAGGSGELRLSPIFQTPDLKLGDLSLMNACNCLIYFAPKPKILSEEHVSLVCNPITKECMVIPKLDPSIIDFWISSSWLGFSPTSGVYKILGIYSTPSPLKLSACVHDVGTSSTWIDIESTPLDNIHWKSSYAFMDGIGYWICFFDNLYNRPPTNFIVFFDFETEIFGKIDAPPSFDQSRVESSGNMFIGIVEESLCLIDHTQSLDIWMMDKSCGQWFKKFSINAVEKTLVEGFPRPIRVCHRWLRPLQLLSNGEILMVSDHRNLVCYDMKTNCFTSINLHMGRSDINVVTFVPNFMSLKDTLYNGQLI